MPSLPRNKSGFYIGILMFISIRTMLEMRLTAIFTTMILTTTRMVKLLKKILLHRSFQNSFPLADLRKKTSGKKPTPTGTRSTPRTCTTH